MSSRMIMRMNLHSFDHEVDPVIYERGMNYYENFQAVQSLEEVGKHEFLASVVGSDMYNVYIRLDKGDNILESSCDCPYDWGPVCKHEVAVWLHLREQGTLEIKEGLTEDGAAFDIQQIEAELASYSVEELQKFVLDLAKRDAKLREKILWELGLIG